MLAVLEAFIKHYGIHQRFLFTQFPRACYRELLTAFKNLVNQPVILIPSMVALAKQCPGYLVIDDTSNPKYGLKHLTRTLYTPATKGYQQGYKVVLFLWYTESGLRLPLGFGLWHQDSLSLTELALEGLSGLRNHFEFKPLAVLADGGYATNEILKRLDDYGWRMVMRLRNDRKLSGKPIRQCIPRGFGEIIGNLENGVRLKVIRERRHFIATHRKMLERQTIQTLYRMRWVIEETFRVLKSCIGLSGCQQSSMWAQALYLVLCLLLFSSVELSLGRFPYSSLLQVNSGQLKPGNLLSPLLFNPS